MTVKCSGAYTRCELRDVVRLTLTMSCGMTVGCGGLSAMAMRRATCLARGTVDAAVGERGKSRSTITVAAAPDPLEARTSRSRDLATNTTFRDIFIHGIRQSYDTHRMFKHLRITCTSIIVIYMQDIC